MKGWQGADTHRLRTPDVLVLDGPPGVLRVESGSVALFAADVRDGRVVGPRRQLLRLGAGQVVCSVPVETDHETRLVLAPVGEATLRELALHRVPRLDAALRRWVPRVTGLLVSGGPPADAVTPPSVARRLGEAGVHELGPGQSVRAQRNAVLWCRVERGAVCWMGDPETTIAPATGPFVLDERTWVTVPESASLRIDDRGDPDSIGAAIAFLHARLLQRCRVDAARDAERELDRRARRVEIEVAARTEARQELAAAVVPGHEVRWRGATPLLRAATAVGNALGIEVRAQHANDAETVRAIARASRVRVRRVLLDRGWWRQDCGALLGRFDAENGGGPVALLPRRRGIGYDLFDPSTDSLRRVDEATAARLSREAWVFYRPLPAGALGLRGLLRFAVQGRGRELVSALVAGLAATVLAMLTPVATALVMDRAIPDADHRLLLEIGAGLLAAAVGQTVFRLSQRLLLLRAGLAAAAQTQAAVWDRLLSLRVAFFRRHSSGNLQDRIRGVTDVGEQLAAVTLSSLFAGFLALINVILLWIYSPPLTGIAVFLGAVVAGFTVALGLAISRNLRQLLERDGELFGTVVQLISAVGKLRVAGAAGRAFVSWLRRYTETVRLRASVQRLQDAARLFHQVVPVLATALLYLLAYDLLRQGRQSVAENGLSLGAFLAFSAAYGSFVAGIVALGNAAVRLVDMAARLHRVQPILVAETEVDGARDDPGRLSGRVSLSDVTFRYGPDEPRVLNGVDLAAEPGEMIALVGPSGSGKSTLLRLLLGFERPESGTVAYDGRDLASLHLNAVRRQLGVVLQSGRLDAGSILDNVACGRPISVERAWAALEDAALAEDVRAMPMGIHTVLSVGGLNLSGGQRQRLLIARALAHRPRILLLDEATASLDNRAQALVAHTLERLDVTRIVVAHRLSTVRGADRIHVLDRGRVVQTGTFEELMRDAGGLFARMMTRQLA